MDNIKTDEGLRVFIINYLAEKLGQHAILKGGMVLRLLDCPRYTNDLDYVFVPFKSKKDIVPLIKKTLEENKEISLQYGLHSTSARFDVTLKNQWGTFRTQIEVNVAQSCESEALSTGDFALHYQQTPHIIRVMRLDVALAHKLAAWNERRLIRDLYDAYFIYKYLQKTPDLETLKKRLQNINYARRMRGGSSLPKKMTLKEFLDLLEHELQKLSPKHIDEELRDSLDMQQRLGLDQKMKITLGQLIEKMRL